MLTEFVGVLDNPRVSSREINQGEQRRANLVSNNCTVQRFVLHCYVVQVSNNGTSFKVTKWKLSYEALLFLELNQQFQHTCPIL